MGLLSRLSDADLYSEKLSEDSGLLHKVGSLQNVKDFSFYGFLKKFNVKCIFELEFFSTYYFCTKSYGLDSSSIFQTNSTKSFWDGLILEEKKIYSFSKKEGTLSPFLQFFSFEKKDTIETLQAYKFSEDSILVLCNQALTLEMIDFYEKITENQTVFVDFLPKLLEEKAGASMFSIDFSKCIETVSSTFVKNNESLKIAFEDSLLKELFTRLSFFFEKPSATKKTSRTAANVIFVSKTVIPEKLLVSHIVKLFGGVIGSSSNLITVNFLGRSRSLTEIKEFLKVI